jgi:hypothetical protein
MAPVDDPADRARRLLAFVEGLPPDEGARVWAWVLVALLPRLDVAKLPTPWVEMLSALAARIGITATSTAAQKSAAMARFVEANALPPAHIRTLVVLLGTGTSDPGALVDAVGKLLGTTGARGVLARTAPPPVGAVAAGPMARFQVKVPDKPKK